MDEVFGEMDCRYRADSIMMSLLRSAMDNAHEKVQSRDGPIECLNERSKFYELAIIQIEGSLKLIKEEPEDRIPETTRAKMITDLTELEHLLRGRLKDTKLSIVEKDRELMEMLENDFRLRQALDSKEKEVFSLKEKLELERTKSETIQEFLLSHHRANVEEANEEDFNELKNSVEKQVLSIKQRLEDERMHFSRKTSANSADFEPEFQSLEEEKREESREKDECSSNKIISVDDWLRPEQNEVIEQMSSDIDILKGTLDLAFGRMQTAEVRPLEKQWRWSIEKETISILIKGFIEDLKQNRERTNDFPNCLELIDEMVKLKGELEGALSIRIEGEVKKSNGLKSPVSDDEVINDGYSPSLRRTTSEPLMDMKDSSGEDSDFDHGGNYVAKMIKNHESIIRKQQKQLNWLKMKEAFRRNEGGLTEKREKELDAIERRVRRVISRLDSVINWKNNSGPKKGKNIRKKIPKCPVAKSPKRNFNEEISKKDTIITRLTEEIDELNLRTLVTEENYIMLLKAMANDRNGEFYEYDIERTIREDSFVSILREILTDWSVNIEKAIMETKTREEIFNFVCVECIKDFRSEINFELQETQNKINECCLENAISDDLYAISFHEIVKETRENLLAKSVENVIENDIYMVFLREIIEELNIEKYVYKLEICFKDDLYQLAMIEAKREGQNFVMKNMGLDLSRQTSIEKIDFLLEFSEQLEEDLAIQRSSSPEDEATLGLVNEKLEKAMRMLSASKEQLRELACDFANESVDVNSTDCETEDAFDAILTPLVGFQHAVTDFEETIHEKIRMNFSRLEDIKKQVDPLCGAMISMKKESSIYKKAFTTRCHNLLLAETEVDLLGDQVEALQNLLRKIYVVLDQNSSVLSCFGALDILKLIKKELND